MYSRLAALPDQAEPLQRAQLLTASHHDAEAGEGLYIRQARKCNDCGANRGEADPTMKLIATA
jgi:hypothetical protein